KGQQDAGDALVMGLADIADHEKCGEAERQLDEDDAYVDHARAPLSARIPSRPRDGRLLCSKRRGRSSVVERQLPKLYVVGSIPIARSNHFLSRPGNSWTPEAKLARVHIRSPRLRLLADRGARHGKSTRRTPRDPSRAGITGPHRREMRPRHVIAMKELCLAFQNATKLGSIIKKI